MIRSTMRIARTAHEFVREYPSPRYYFAALTHLYLGGSHKRSEIKKAKNVCAVNNSSQRMLMTMRGYSSPSVYVAYAELYMVKEGQQPSVVLLFTPIYVI